jgi:hypothetical protein
MKTAPLIGLLLLILSAACTQRMICPAYQSAFIYDKDALKKKFSYFKEDSTPRIFTASTGKSKYLIAVPESYRKKLRSLQTVEMKPVYPVIPDSLKLDKEEDLLLAERDVIDSTAQQTEGIDPSDSLYAITKTKEKYNIEQDNYMWYFRNTLVLPDVRAAMDEKKNAKKEKENPQGKSGKKGFFKNLFKKKEKRKDSTDVSAPPISQNDSSSNVSAPKEKGGLFKKKDKTSKKPQPDKKKTDAKKDDEDDGF